MTDQRTLIDLTAEIAATHVANNSVQVGEIAVLIETVYRALSSLRSDPTNTPGALREPAVSFRASVKPDFLICLACGARKTTLKRHLMSAHNLTIDQYRHVYGLSPSYPTVAPEYSERRSELAHAMGLGGTGGRRSAKDTTRA